MAASGERQPFQMLLATGSLQVSSMEQGPESRLLSAQFSICGSTTLNPIFKCCAVMGVGQSTFQTLMLPAPLGRPILAVSLGGIGCISPNDQGKGGMLGQSVCYFLSPFSFSLSLSSLTVSGLCFPRQEQGCVCKQ